MKNLYILILISCLYYLALLKPIESVPKIKVQEVIEKPPVTTVVLLNSGKADSSVVVSNEKGSGELDKVGKFLELTDSNSAPSSVKNMSEEEINRRFSNALSASAKKPISFFLYFKPRSMKLTNESQKKFKEALRTMEERYPCIVDVIGHTDTTGSEKINFKVSLKRAKFIQAQIEKKNINIHTLNVKGFGEIDLLVDTPDNTDEAKNRNVEILIK